MIRAVLFDLDDTLLSNDMDRFLPAYLQLLAQDLAAVVPPERLVTELLRGTSAMLANHDPEKTLQQAFAEVFYPGVGEGEATLAPLFEAFYRGRFEQLKELTHPRSEVPSVVQSIRSAGYLVGVATNPMMPAIAVAARLRWAGMPAENAVFALVASYEGFHFAKPDPAFFVEMTARLGLSPAEAAMVGNSLADDIEPAARLGMPTYLVGEPDAPAQAGGPLVDVPAWVKTLDGARPGLEGDGVALEARLRGNLAALRTLCVDLTSNAWATPGPDAGWSATEIACHLRDVEREVNLPRLEAVLMQDNPFLPASDPDQWAAPRNYPSQSGMTALRDFSAARQGLLTRLRALGPEALRRPARHALLGPTSLRELMAIVAEHDVLHLRQVLDVVGPPPSAPVIA
jgi:FMN phosphatase YigB (HAD superfamily)